jgi:hypothetical protein
VGLGWLLHWASIYYVSPDIGRYFSRADLDGIAPTLPLFVGATLLGMVVAIGAALAFAGVDTVHYLSLAGPNLVPALTLSSLAALASAGHGHTTTVVR